MEEDGVRVFFTNVYRSTDKPHCERTHEYFRYVVPKGYSLDGFSQDDIDRIYSNVNSYAREELEWKSPYELFAEAFSLETLRRLRIERKSPDEVDLSPLF